MKKIWITGGGSGIGKALALRLRKDKNEIFISGRTEEKLKSVGKGTTPVPCDITDRNSVDAAIEKIGDIDLAILNAGTYAPGPTTETSMDDFKSAMEVNYFGTLNCLQALLPRMRKKGGHIVVVASLAGYIGLPNSSGYGPSKAAVISLCESIRAELHNTDIKFQMVSPGFVKSPLTEKNNFKMPHLIKADEAAEEIIQGLESKAFEIAFPAPFVRQMKFLRLLPYKLYFPLINKVTTQ